MSANITCIQLYNSLVAVCRIGP